MTRILCAILTGLVFAAAAGVRPASARADDHPSAPGESGGAAGRQGAAAADPIVGMWWGRIGEEPEAEDAGIEFRRTEAGSIEACITLPIMSYYGLKTDGPVVRDGDSFDIKSIGLSGKIAGDAIDGFTGSKRTLHLARAASLPASPAMPDLPRGPEPLWTVQLGAPVYAPVAVRDGVAYIGTVGGVFQAVRLRDHTLAWTFSAGRPVFGGALVTDDAVYFACDNGYLFKLDRATGKESWRYDLGDARVSRVLGHSAVFDFDHAGPCPVIEGGVVYIGSGDGSLHAVDSASGSRLWRADSGGGAKVRTDAAVDAERVFVGTLEGKLLAFSRKDGSPVWNKDVAGPVTSNPRLIEGMLIVGSRGSVLRAMRPENGESIWKKSYWGSWVESTPTAIDDGLVIGSSDLRRITRHDLTDGKVRWRTDVFGLAWGQPAVHGGRVYVATSGIEPYVVRHEGAVLALDGATGAIEWRWPAPRCDHAMHTGFAAGPVIDGETLLVAGLDGSLYAFALGS